MSFKNVVLAVTAVAVLAMGVYLFVQVRSTPAQASGSAAAHPVAPPTHDRVAEPAPRPPRDHGSPSAEARHTPAITTPQKTPDPGLEPVEPTDAEKRVDLKKDNLMAEANKAYDRQEFDDAIQLAGKILATDPNNVRMLRIIVSASCIQGDPAIAQANYEKLPKLDREQMQRRCDRYGVTFKDP